jgi:hypothetical protein
MQTWKLIGVGLVALALTGLVAAAPERSNGRAALTGAADEWNLERLGDSGGTIVEAITVVSNTAYVGMVGEFAVLDISNPAQPTRLGYRMFDGAEHTAKIGVTGHYAVIGLTDGRLKIIDLADLAHLSEVSEITPADSTIDLAVTSDYAYVLGGDSTATNALRVIDISDPTAPVEVGRTSTGYYYNNFALTGYYAVANQSMGGLHIIDLHDPTHPVEVGTYPLGGAMDDLAAQGNLVYAVTYDGLTGTLHVLNLSSSGSLTQLGSTNLQALTNIPGYGDLVITANRAYVAGLVNTILQIVDVADPAHPAWRGMYTSPAGVAFGGAAGNRAMVVTGGHGWRIIDAANVQQPIEVGAYDPPPYALFVSMVNNVAYVAGAGLQLVDVADPQHPSPLSAVFTGGADVVRVSGNFAYVWKYPSDLRVLNVANPMNPILIKTYNQLMQDFDVAGQYAYLTDFLSGLHIWNISQPTAWIEVGSVPLNGSSHVTIANQRAYVVTMGYTSYGRLAFNTLTIVNVSNPAQPTIIGTWTAPYEGLTDVWVEGDLAYVTFYSMQPSTGLLILDVSNAAQPRLLGVIGRLWHYEDPALNNTASSVNVAGRLAYVAQNRSGVHVIDVSDPGVPTEVGWHNTPGEAYTVVASGTLAYVAEGSKGLSIFEMHGSLAGHLDDAIHSPLALSDVKVSASRDVSTTTDVSGQFQISHLNVTTYTVTPTLSGFVFVPPTVTVSAPSWQAEALRFVVLPSPTLITLTPGVIATLAYTEPNGASIEAVFPADVLSQTTTIILTPTLAAGGIDRWFTGHAFDLATPISLRPDLAFNAPVTITIHYIDRDVSVVSDEAALQLAWWDGAQWIDAASTCSPVSSYTRDTTANILSVPVCGTGGYALFGPTHQLHLPALRR